MTNQQLLNFIKQGERQNLKFQEKPKEKDIRCRRKNYFNSEN